MPDVAVIPKRTTATRVNTELMDSQADRGVPAGQLLQPAITTYAGFPFFCGVRRTSQSAIFALDLVLGRPRLVGMYHDYFRAGFALARSLAEQQREVRLAGFGQGLSLEKYLNLIRAYLC